MGDSWLENVANAKIFRDVDVMSQAAKLLGRNRHNRIVLEGKQVKCLVALRLMASRLTNQSVRADEKEQPETREQPWTWISNFCDLIEDYQLTLGKPENSRQQFLQALKREMQQQQEEQHHGFGK